MAFTWVRPQQPLDPEIEVFSPESDEAEDDTGTVLDERYELREAIAWGGTAAVYKAFDRHTRVFVAVKVLCSGLREQIGAYFDQEGRVAAQISNPHLVRAHDRGLGDPPYIVFELVPGQPISQLYYSRPMPWRELCEVMLRVLDALDALHQEGIVHRDVKPDNVLVQHRIGRESRVWLLDVGFAAVPPGRITNAPAPDEIVFGTCGYIAPEYFAGHPPEPRCDLYSVGATLYRMLTTQPVMDARDLGDLLAIPPPRVLAPGAEIPEAVEDIVMRALSDIEVRFQSAREMADAIRAALAAPAESIAPPAIERVVTMPSLWWSGATLAVGVGLGVVSTVGVVSLRTGDAQREAAAPVEAESGAGLVAAAASTRARSTSEDAAVEAEPSKGFAAPEVDASRLPMPEMPVVDSHLLDASNEASSVIPSPRAASAPADASTSSKATVLAAAGETKHPATRVVRPAPRGAKTFAGAMAALEPKIRACATEYGVPLEPTMVKVRGAGGSVESIRVLGMSSQHPFAQCVDKVIRAARPPLDEPVEAFEFFRKR